MEIGQAVAETEKELQEDDIQLQQDPEKSKKATKVEVMKKNYGPGALAAQRGRIVNHQSKKRYQIYRNQPSFQMPYQKAKKVRQQEMKSIPDETGFFEAVKEEDVEQNTPMPEVEGGFNLILS